MAGGWRDRPVFVSSTFRDMHAERDHLSRFVFPELAERLRERRHELTPIDLRWGVETTAGVDAAAKELLVLKVCLAEIERSRPFFVGLFGDRYGWVAPAERMRRAAIEAGFDGEVAGMSVTALEVEYGALADPEKRARTFFYLREPLPYDEMDPAMAAVFSDQHSPAPDAAEAFARLTALKQRVQSEFGDRVRHYRAGWDSERERVIGLEEFGRLVLEDLWEALDAETAEFAAKPPASWQDDERTELEVFVEERSRDFVGRDALLGDLYEFALSPPSIEWGVCVVAGPGAGKSAVVAALNRRLAEVPEVLVLAHSAGISTRSTSVEALLERWVGELAAHAGAEDPTVGVSGREQLQDLFAEWLSRVAVSTRVVALLDAIDQFDPTPVARHLTWLPELWPRNARLVATTLPGPQAEALAGRPGVTTVALQPLTTAEASAAAEAVSRRYHRSLPAAALAALIAKEGADGTSASGTPLWLELVLEELLLFDEDDYARAATFSGTAEQQLDALLVATIDAVPSDVAGAYDTLLARTEHAYGEAWARSFAELLAASRSGLRESDLRVLLPAVSGETWSDLRFAALRRGFRGHLTQRGSLAQWDFTHALARQAVEARHLTDHEHGQHIHQQIADHLAALPDDDPLTVTEHMWHLIAADNKVAAAGLYASDLSPEALDAATQALAHHILNNPNGLDWTTQLLETDDVEGLLPGLYGPLGALLYVVSDDLPPVESVRLAAAIRDDITIRFGRVPENIETITALIRCEDRLKSSYLEAGDLRGAEAAIHRSIDIAEALHRRSPNEYEFTIMVALMYGSLGDLERDTGQLADALRVYERQLDLLATPHEPSPQEGFVVGLKASVHISKGNTEEIMGDLEQARSSYEAALAIEEELAQDAERASEQPDRLAVPLDRMGQLKLKTGELVDATRYLQRAVSIREAALKRRPDSVKLAQGLMGSLRTLAGIYDTISDGQAALATARRVVEVAERLYDRQPDSTEESGDLVGGLSNLSVCQQAVGDVESALATGQRSLHIAADIYERAPGLSSTGDRLLGARIAAGGAYEKAGDAASALEQYRLAVELGLELLAKAPNSIDAAERLGVAHSRLGDFYFDRHELGEAGAAYARWASVLGEAHRSAPESAVLTEHLAAAYNSLGRVHRESGDLHSARDAHLRALEIAGELPADVSLPVVARAYEGLAEVADASGDLSSAVAAAEAALSALRTIHDRVTESAQSSRDLAAAHTRLASLHEHRGDIDASLEQLRAAIGLRDQLAARDPGSAIDAHALAASYRQLAIVESARGDAAAARLQEERALGVEERLLLQYPDDFEAALETSKIHASLGVLDLEAGDHSFARREFNRSLEIVERLRNQDPSDPKRILHLAAANERVGFLHAVDKEPTAAIDSYQRALSLFVELYEMDPDNLDAARSRANCHETLRSVRMAVGDHVGASQDLQAALAIRQWLHELAPEDPEARYDLVLLWMERGDAAIAAGDLAMARATYQAALGVLSPLHAEVPGDLRIAFTLQDAQETLGMIYRDSGDLEAACTAHHEGLETAEDLVRRDPRDARALRALAMSHLSLGHAYDASGRRRRADRHMRECQKTLRVMRDLGLLDEWLAETLGQIDALYS